MREINKPVCKIILAGWLLLFNSALLYADNIPTLRIGYIPITDHLTLGITQKIDANKFKHAKLEPVKIMDRATMVEALRSKSLDGAFVLGPLAFQARITGIPIKTLLLGHRDGSALIVRTKIGIDKPEDLRNKTIAIPSKYSLHNMLLHKVLVSASIDPETEVKIVEMSPMEMPAALFNGSVDAFIVAEPIGSKAEKLGAGKVLLLSNEIWKHHPDCLFVVQEDIIHNYHDAVQELVSSLISSAEYIEHDRKSAAEIGGPFLGHSPEIIIHALTVPSTDRVTFHNLTPLAQELEVMQDYMSDTMGVFTKKLDIATSIDDQFALEGYKSLGLRQK